MQVVQDDNYQNLYKQVCRDYVRPELGWLNLSKFHEHPGFQVVSFSTKPDGEHEITFVNPKGNTMSILIRMARISFTIQEVSVSPIQYHRKDCLAVGITIGDLLKFGSNASTDTLPLLKSAGNVETRKSKITQCIGTFNSTKGLFHTWGLAATASDTATLEEYCSQIVLFEDSEVKKMVVKRSQFQFLLEHICTSDMAKRLLTAFDEKQNLEMHKDNSIVEFSEDLAVPDILLLLHDMDPQPIYMNTYRRIMKTLNQSEQKTLEEKYPESAFRNVKCIPDHYPAFVLRNSKIKNWQRQSLREFMKDCRDIEHLDKQYQRLKRNPMYKHSATKSEKQPDVQLFWNNRMPQGSMWRCYRTKGKIAEKQRRFNSLIKDGKEIAADVDCF